MPIIEIDDPDDPRVAAYRDIRERDLVGRQNRFIAEGKVVLRVLFSERRFEAESLLVLENRLAGATDILEMVPEELPVYVAGARLMDMIAGFNMHRGLLGIGLRGTRQTADAIVQALPERALVVVLAGISNHDNVGSIFRNAAAFGADAVLLDAQCCDPLYRKAIRVSVGACLKAPFALGGNVLELADTLRRAGFSLLALSPSAETDLSTIDRPPRLAVFLGTEGEGLPEDVLASMATARIAMRRDFDSLNVAAASAIALHRLADP